MKGILIAILISIAVCILGFEGSHYLASVTQPPQAKAMDNTLLTAETTEETPTVIAPAIPIKSLKEIRKALHEEAPALSQNVINSVMTALKCAKKNEIEHNHILTIIDYSLPSNEKRLWVFDLSTSKLLFNTYVSHGIKSGSLSSQYFSNQYNSKASSIGIFSTEKEYRGRHGDSLKLLGLDKKFNDNAYNRFIVMHGAWYVEEWFIKKYGRPGRSWGCPVLPQTMAKPIIDTIKDNAFLLVYYPNNTWLSESKFLNCETTDNNEIKSATQNDPAAQEEKPRESIMFVDINKDGKRVENDPILVVSADDYQHLLNKTVPLSRMLRRQINHQEFIALTPEELKQLEKSKTIATTDPLNLISLVIPVVKMQRGYYTTEMQVVTLGKISKIELTNPNHYTLYFSDKPPLDIKFDNYFIRWLGL